MERGLRSLMRLRLAGGGPSLSETTADESIPSGQGVPLVDGSCDRGGDGYAKPGR